jgi:hypothetical protein
MAKIKNDRRKYRTRAALVTKGRGPANLDQHFQDYRAYLLENSDIDFLCYVDMRFHR